LERGGGGVAPIKTKAKRPGPLSIHSINDTIPAHHKGKGYMSKEEDFVFKSSLKKGFKFMKKMLCYLHALLRIIIDLKKF
jgi:hypothetical protein